MNDLISVVIPVYKAEQYLPRCIESILSQTYPHLEVILVDDGSPDGSGALCDALAAGDTRIKVIHKENGGVASARNAGMEAATGEHLMFVDSDDYIKPHMVETLLRTAVEEDADLVIGGFTALTKRRAIRRTFGAGVYRGHEQVAAMLDKTIGISAISACWGKLYRTAAIKEQQDTSLPLGEDWVFCVQNLKHMQTIALLDEELYYYECRNQSLTRSKYRLNSAILDRTYLSILNEFEEYYKEAPILPTIKKEYLYKLIEDARKTTRSLCGLSRRLKEIKLAHAETIEGLDGTGVYDAMLKRKKNFPLVIQLRWLTAKERTKAFLKFFIPKSR